MIIVSVFYCGKPFFHGCAIRNVSYDALITLENINLLLHS